MRNLFRQVAAYAATFLFSATLFAQSKPFSKTIETPSTKEEFVDNEPTQDKKIAPPPAVKEPMPQEARAITASPSQRQLQQHSVGIGLGQTFLLGNYSDHGENKITMDLMYAYAASYSFDVLINAHWSEHADKNEKSKMAGLTGSIKSRLYEFDNFSPFVIAGLGFYAPRVKREIGGETQWSKRKLTFGANFGGGVDLRLNEEWTVGAMGQLHWPFNVKQDDQPDVKGYYFKLLLTLAYSF